jgi:hypothetical protein
MTEQTKKALCIGINNYPGTDSDLAGCVQDASDWSELLKSKGFVVKTLLDKQATGAAIVSNLKQLITQAIPGDELVIQYSGHGTQVPDQNREEADNMDEAWVPYDIWEKGPVLDDTLWSILRMKQPAVKIIVLSDSCHSGSVVRAFFCPDTCKGKKKFIHYTKAMSKGTLEWFFSTFTGGGERAFTIEESEKVPWPCLLLSGCQDHEYSYDANFNGKANGAFTYWAIKILKELPHTATYLDWYRAIRRALPNSQYPQCPNIMGSYQGHTVFT